MPEIPQMVKSYWLQEQIGEGGFGAVYRAYQTVVEREVAIKVILPELANDPDFIRGFDMEARLVAALEHPFIVPLFDYWREPDGAYLVMRYFPMGNLHGWLKKNGAMPTRQIIKLVQQLGSALDYAHQHQVVHLDIKPANILLDQEQNAYLGDFGVSKIISPIPPAEDENIAISPAYSPPEIIRRGAPLPQSDIYSLGYVVYELLTGTHPFRRNPSAATPYALLHFHLTENIPELADFNPAVTEVLRTATDKTIEARYQSAGALAAALEDALSNKAQAVPVSQRETVLLLSNPYKGLRPFAESDADSFFGRAALITQLLQRLRESHFLGLIGPSGSGKSSVIHAGLLPALRRNALDGSGQWFIAQMVPGENPYENLKEALMSVATTRQTNLLDRLQESEDGLLDALDAVLSSPADVLLLVIDQFEEVFTQTTDEQIRRAFLNLVARTAEAGDDGIRIVITLRADFYDHPLRYERFGGLLRTYGEVVLPLSAGEIEQVIVKPAERVGLLVDSELVTTIVADVYDEAGALPLLQYALTEVFEARQDNRLTLAAYRAIGGVSGALARRAEQIYSELTPPAQGITQQAFLRLVTLGEGAEDTRRRAKQSELGSIAHDAATLDAVLNIFGKYRLLSFDRDPDTREPTVEVAHESLLYSWGRLADWIAAHRADIRQQRILNLAAEQWSGAGQDASYLLAGARLASIEDWAASNALSLTKEEQSFLAASLAERSRQQAQAAQQQQREADLMRNSRNRLRYLLGVFVAATVISIFLGVEALQQSRDASAARDRAEDAALEARTQALVANAGRALVGGDSALATTLVLDAAALVPQSPAVKNSLGDLLHAPALVSVLAGDGQGMVARLASSPDGRYVLAGEGSRNSAQAAAARVTLWDTASGERLLHINEHRGSITGLAFVPGKEWAVSASADSLVLVWELATGKIIHRFDTLPRGEQTSISVNTAQQLLVTVRSNSAPQHIIFDLNTGQESGRKTFENGQMLSHGYWFPQGTLVLSSMMDGSQIIWDSVSGDVLHQQAFTFNFITREFYDTRISPDGQVVVVNAGEQIALWNFEQNTIIYVPMPFAALAAFAVTDDHFLAGSTVGEFGLWTFDGAPTGIMGSNPSTNYESAVLLPGQPQAVLGRIDGGLEIWDYSQTPPDFVDHFATIHQTAHLIPLDDEQAFLLVGIAPTSNNPRPQFSITQWSLDDQQMTRRLNTEGISPAVFPGGAALSADGRWLLVGTLADVPGKPRTTAEQALVLWDAQSGEIVQQTRFSAQDDVFAATFIGDSSQAFVAVGKRLQVWDVATWELQYDLIGHSGVARAVAYNPHDGSLLSSTEDNTLRVWDPATGAVRLSISDVRPSDFIAVHPTQNRVAFHPGGNQIVIWDLATNQELHRLIGHESIPIRAAFSRDGNWLVSGDRGGMAMVWDAQTGALLNQYDVDRTVVAVGFLAEDRQIMLANSHDGITLWDFKIRTPQLLLEWVRAYRYARPVLPADCQQYNLAQSC